MYPHRCPQIEFLILSTLTLSNVPQGAYSVNNIEMTIKTPNVARSTPNATLNGRNAEPNFSHHRLRLPLSSASRCRLVNVLSSRCKASNSFLSLTDICCPVP